MTRILWLDLETTGLDPNKDTILEYGLLVTEGLDTEVDSLSIPVHPHGFNPFALDDVVYAMHSESGLLDAMRAEGLRPMSAVAAVGGFLDTHFDFDATDIVVGGSGIDRFDVPMLRSNSPALAGRFHWRTLDVSGLKQVMGMAGVPIPPVETQHRAVDDARWAFHVAQRGASLLGVGAHELGLDDTPIGVSA